MRLGQRFESARRLSLFGVYKPNTRNDRGSFGPSLAAVDTTELLAEGCVLILDGFLSMKGTRWCSAGANTGLAANRVASRGVIGNPRAQLSRGRGPGYKVRLSQSGRVVHHIVLSPTRTLPSLD
jgi:hypothetical protein